MTLSFKFTQDRRAELPLQMCLSEKQLPTETTSVPARWLRLSAHPSSQESHSARKPGCFRKKLNQKPLTSCTLKCTPNPKKVIRACNNNCSPLFHLLLYITYSCRHGLQHIGGKNKAKSGNFKVLQLIQSLLKRSHAA